MHTAKPFLHFSLDVISTMNTWSFILLAILLCSYLLESLVTLFNIRTLSPNLPEEYTDVYDENRYQRSKAYSKTNGILTIVKDTFFTAILLLFLILRGFNALDLYVRSFGLNPVLTGILFLSLLGFASWLLSLPFEVYRIFIIEEKFGFNKMDLKTWLTDTLKSLFVVTIIGGPLLAIILWFFKSAGPDAWLLCWIGLILFTVTMQYLAPVLIMPLFNKFTPLESGPLRDAIKRYAHQENFQIQDVYTMDGSRRPTKLNAFFSGFGRYRKIVFFDTLLKKLSDEQILAVLAHEIGHFKLKHLLKMLFISCIQLGITLYLLSFFLNYPKILTELGMQYFSVYAGLTFFGILYTPISEALSIATNMLSRRYEFEADSFAARTTGTPEALISSLKQLSAENLSNLTPHPLYVFLHYSHPPLLQRIRHLNGNTDGN